MSTLDELLDAGDRQEDRAREAGRQVRGYLRIGVWTLGWALARLVAALMALVAGVFFTVGWLCARSVPELKFVWTAFVLGWEAGRPRGGGRVPA